VIIKDAKRIFNSDKICCSYYDFYFGVTFLEHTVLISLKSSRVANYRSLLLVQLVKTAHKRKQSINQSINLFVQMQNKHWTGHQGRMKPPLTGAHKTMLVRATNDNTSQKKI